MQKILFSTTLVTMALCLAVSFVHADEFRLMTHNTLSIGSSGSQQYNALLQTVERVCPDVVVFQEIDDVADIQNFQDLASDAGYPYSEVSDISGTMSGDLMTACMSQFMIESTISWSSAEISGDSEANDITRDIFELRISLPGGHHIGVFTVHLKAYTDDVSKFRRQIEISRACQVMDEYNAAYPDDFRVIAGDFNQDYGNGIFGSPTWNSLPSELPYSYSLGNDIEFPITYDPFETILSRGFNLVDATWEDSTTNFATYPSYDSRIDYIFFDGDITNIGDEVYYSTQDNGIDDSPTGNWIFKCGSSLASSTSTTASDHLPVAVDLYYSDEITPVPTQTPTSLPTNTPTPTPSTPCLHHGDVDFNGSITAGDAQMAFFITLGIISPTEMEACAADCNDSGYISAADAQQIFSCLFGDSCADPL